MSTVTPESRLFDFEYQFVKYGEFHSNKINQLIHLIFVPLILWTGQVWGCFTPVISEWPLEGLVGLNAAFLFTAIYIIYYISLHRVIGLLYAPILLSMLIGANRFAETEYAAMVSMGLHVFAWVVQVWIGHHVFEKRAPAITENPVQGAVLGKFV